MLSVIDSKGSYDWNETRRSTGWRGSGKNLDNYFAIAVMMKK